MASLTDVAAAAGVSVSTASFVLNGHAEEMRISPQTAERVLQAVRQLGYVPNVAARKLTSRSDRTNVIPDIALMWSPDQHPSVLGSFITHAQHCFNQNFVQKMHITIEPFFQGPLNISEMEFLDRHYNGVVFSPSFDENFAHIAQYNRRIPLIALHVETKLLPNVIVDYHYTGSVAAELFAAKGRRAVSILYRAHMGTTSRTDLRRVGFCDTCGKLGLVYSENEIPPISRFSLDARAQFGRAQALHYLETKTLPEAIFIQDDVMAASFMVLLLTAGVRIPDDIEIITYSNEELTGAIFPGITTVNYPAAAITEATLRLISQQLSDPYAAPKQIKIKPDITFRGSCPKPDGWPG